MCFFYYRNADYRDYRLTPFASQFIRLGLLWKDIQEEKPLLPWDEIAKATKQRPCGSSCHSGLCEIAQVCPKFPFRPPGNRRIKILKERKFITEVKVTPKKARVFKERNPSSKNLSRKKLRFPIVSPLCSTLTYESPQDFTPKPGSFYVSPKPYKEGGESCEDTRQSSCG